MSAPQAVLEKLTAEGYLRVRELPTGELAGLMIFNFTVGLCVGLNPRGYRIRYCYSSGSEALAALEAWDGQADPSGPWIKAKGIGIDRPNTFMGIPVVATREPARTGTKEAFHG